jgi:hypothetical protein
MREDQIDWLLMTGYHSPHRYLPYRIREKSRRNSPTMCRSLSRLSHVIASSTSVSPLG